MFLISIFFILSTVPIHEFAASAQCISCPLTLEGTPPLTPGSNGFSGSSNLDETLTFGGTVIKPFHGDGSRATEMVLLAEMLPSAIDRAMQSLSIRLQTEAESASRSNEHSDRPFKFVQLFLRTRALARKLGLSSHVLLNAAQLLLAESGLPKPRALTILRSMASPLRSLPRLSNPDEPIALADAGTCPWPTYAPCRIQRYRSFDGSCNNLLHPIWGRSFMPLARSLPADYGDGLQMLRRDRDGNPLPSARLVSMTIAEDYDLPDHMHSQMLMLWGQFTDHDLSLTALSKDFANTTNGLSNQTVDINCGTDGCSAERDECRPIAVPVNDSSFAGKLCLEFVRSQAVPDINCSMGSRQQLNQITSYIDASHIYGSTKQDADNLRNLADSSRGQLRYTHHPTDAKAYKYLLPQAKTLKQCRDFDDQHLCFMAGDDRVNEQSILAMMHTIWMREHNRIEGLLHRMNPTWNGETLFQETRRIVGATVQHITFNEFLPIVLGPKLVETYRLNLTQSGYFTGYDASVEATIMNAFTTAAFRFGHSQLPTNVRRTSTNNKPFSQRLFHLSQLLNRPKTVYSVLDGGIDSLVQGLASHHVQRFDRYITKEVTAHLFANDPPHGVGLDLVSLNIQRGRDHGIPGYNQWRKWCNLSSAKDFEDLAGILDPNVKDKFKSIYRHVDDIDLFPGGISERSVDGGLIGPTFGCIIGRQFERLRIGDRFWYENPGANSFSAEQLDELRKVTLAKVICENSDNITMIQPNIMQLPFRATFPERSAEAAAAAAEYGSGLGIDWFHRLWTSNYNARVNCNHLPQVDLTKWTTGDK